MLGLDNPIHLAFILILLLLVFGAKRLPEMGASLGEGLRGFKHAISGEHPAETVTPAAPTVTAASPMVTAASPAVPVAVPVGDERIPAPPAA